VLTVGIPNVFGKRMAVSAFDATSAVAKEILVVAQSGNVGINVSFPLWPLDVNGGMQLNGRLFVTGSSGITGQVLTSNGVLAPSWQTLSAPFDNNVRFSFTGSYLGSFTNGDLTFTTRYNTNPTAVSLSGTTITFSQTGLYHLEAVISGFVDYSTALSFNPRLSLDLELNGGVGAGSNPVANTELIRLNISGVRYGGTAYASTDLFITTGQTLNAFFSYSSLGSGGTIGSTTGYLRGYLISN